MDVIAVRLSKGSGDRGKLLRLALPTGREEGTYVLEE